MSGSALKAGRSPTAAQVLAACCAALGSSVYLFLGVLTLLPQLAAFEREFLLEQRPLSMLRTLCLGVAVAGAVPPLVAGLWPSLGALACLLAWGLAEAAKQLWAFFLHHPSPLPGWPGTTSPSRTI